MRALRAFFFLLLFFSLESVALSEYAFIYQNTPPSFFQFLIAPKSCDGFLNNNVNLAPQLRDDKQYGEALAFAQQAVVEMSRAKNYAAVQNFLGSPVWGINSIPVYRYASMSCYSYAGNALSLSVESAKIALQTLDSDIAELSKMADESHPGIAGGVIQELVEIQNDVYLRKTEGDGFGKLFVRYANENNALFDDLLQASPAEIVAGINKIIGNKSSLVEEIILLDYRVNNAIGALEQEETEKQDIYGQTLRDVENNADFLKAEGLGRVSENAFVLIGSASGLYSEYSIGSFEDDFRTVENKVENAKAIHSETNKVFLEKKNAYASRGMEKLDEANALLKESLQILQNVEERSVLLEEKLRNRVLVEQDKTRSAAEKTQNAFAAALATDELDKNIDALASVLRTRGERISFFMHEITQLHEIQKQALAVQPAEEAQERLLSGVKSAKADAEKAEADGVDVNYEKMRLRDLETAANALGNDAASQARAITLERDLQTISDAITAAEAAVYSELLEGYFARAEELKLYFDVRTQAKIESVEGYFRFGKLDVQTASGQLKEIKQALEDALSEIDLKTPSMLKRILEDSAIVTEEISAVQPGELAEITFSVEITNPLDLDYDGQLALDLKLPQNALMLEKSDTLIFSGGKIYLQGVSSLGKSFLKGGYSQVVATIESESSETVFATQSGARKKLTVSFNAKKAAPVLIEKTFPPLALAAVYSQAPFEKSIVQESGGTKLGLIITAKEGKNTVEITYEPANPPFEIKRNVVRDGNSITFLYDIRNIFEDLENATISEVQDVPCEALSAKTQSEVKANAAIANNQIFINIETDSFRKNDNKLVRFLIQCASTPDVTPLISFDYNKTKVSFENGSKEDSAIEISKAEAECATECGQQAKETLAQAKSFYKNGFYAKATELAKKAQEQAKEFKTQKLRKNEEKRGVILKYPDLKNSLGKASGEFNQAFSVKQGQESTRSKTLQYQEGLSLLKAGEKSLAKLEKPFEKQGTGEMLDDYTQEFLEQYSKETEDSINGVNEVIQNMRERSRQELELASERQKQFGTAQTKIDLESANAEFQSGKVFTAWLAASELNRKLTGAPQAPEQQRDYSVFFGIAGIIIIFGLAFVFLKRGKKPLLEEF